MVGVRGRREWIMHPARLVPLAFMATIAVGTALLLLPPATRGPGGTDPVTALFTATSAVCVTGLSTVDTGTYWSPLGQGLILAMIQIGGFGIAAGATLAVWLVMGRLGLNTRMLAQAETRSSGIGGARRILVFVGTVTVLVEVSLAALLSLRLLLSYDRSWPDAVWEGSFHAVSAFNNAGFSLYSDSLVDFAGDVFFGVPLSIAVIIGGIGFPVLLELYRRRRGRIPGRIKLSLHARLTLLTYGGLLAFAFGLVLFFEWRNPGTLGPLGAGEKIVTGFVESVQPRTSGFTTVDYSQMREETLAGTIGLMFVGGGSGGTAGGIKVTTFVILAFVLIAEARGDEDVTVFNRRIAPETQRQAVAVALLSVGVVFLGTVSILAVTPQNLSSVFFEATSAFATVGLSLGITADMSTPAQLIVVVLMYLGRVGPVAAFTLFALRSTQRHYRYPESRPLVG
jgi:trk system potassium uptake protein TrkH